MRLRSQLAKILRRLARRIDPDPLGSMWVGDEFEMGQLTIAGKAVNENVMEVFIGRSDVEPQRPIPDPHADLLRHYEQIKAPEDE